MADNETEVNPCKKLKTDHNPDRNGDHSESDLTKALQKPGSSQDKGESHTEVTDTDETNKTDACDKDKGDRHDNVEEEKVEVNRNEGGKNEDKDNDDEEVDRDTDADSNREVEMSDAESDVSALSDMSGLSGEGSWKAAPAGPMAWVYRCMEDGVDPRSILRQVISDDNDIPDVDDFTLWKLVVNLVSEPPPRKKLPDVNTLEDVIRLLLKCEKIMVLTGAGVSVSCGIPDFRSRNGIYARLAMDFPDLPDPQAMFDIGYFKKDQRPFYKFAKEIYPGQFEPSRCHKFIHLIEEHGKLLRNYTQNIDTLEQVAGIKNVIQCHGSFATATCMECHHKCSSDDIKEEILNQVIPWCRKCYRRTPLSVMKPDIVFFGESLPEEFHHQMSVDKDNCDLLIVIGSSLKVRPVALIPNSLPAHVPQILINKEHLRNMNFDVELLGDCEVVVGEICRRLGEEWTKIANKESMTQISMDELLTPPSSPKSPETKPGKSEPRSDDTKRHTDKDQVISENSGNIDSSKTDVKENADGPVEDSNDKCLDSDITSERKGSAEVGSKKFENTSENSQSTSTTQNKTSDSVEESVNTSHIETKTSEQETNETTTENEVSDKAKAEHNDNETVDGQRNSASTETDNVGKEADNDKSNGDSKPGCSSADNEKPGSTSNASGRRRMWRSSRQNVASRLGTNKFCFIPPHKYIFPEAEYFTWVKSDTESEDDTNKDTTMDSSRELNQTHTTESSAFDDEVIDLSTDDEDDKELSNETKDVPDEADTVKNSDTDAVSKDLVGKVQDSTAEIVIN